MSGFLAAMLGYDRAKMLVFVVLPLLRAFLKNTDVAHHSLGITGGAVGRLLFNQFKLKCTSKPLLLSRVYFVKVMSILAMASIGKSSIKHYINFACLAEFNLLFLMQHLSQFETFARHRTLPLNLYAMR